MFKKFSIAVISIIMLITLAGCGSSTPTDSSINAGSDNTQINPSNNDTETEPTDEYQMLPIISGNVAGLNLDASADGSSLQLKKGQVMSITLESNPSTGYSWFAISSKPDVLVQMREPEYLAPTSDPANPVVGAAGTETYYFQAADAGTVTLTLDYKRGWETDINPEKTITITVEVK